MRLRHAVIAVSRWVADQAIEVLGLPPERLHVVPHGVAPTFAPTPREGSDHPPYLLFVGEYDGRKRHELAFGVIGGLAERGLPHRLKVVGRIAPWWEQTLSALVHAAPCPHRIELCGYVDEPTLVRLYQQADALVVTSSAEGFGLPALEAMACGTPVVAFDNSATAEVVGPGGVLVPDGDVAAMVDALVNVLREGSAHEELGLRALARAEQFTWEKTARKVLALYFQG